MKPELRRALLRWSNAVLHALYRWCQWVLISSFLGGVLTVILYYIVVPILLALLGIPLEFPPWEKLPKAALVGMVAGVIGGTGEWYYEMKRGKFMR